MDRGTCYGSWEPDQWFSSCPVHNEDSDSKEDVISESGVRGRYLGFITIPTNMYAFEKQ